MGIKPQTWGSNQQTKGEIHSTSESETSESEILMTDLLIQLKEADPSFHVMLNKYHRYIDLKRPFNYIVQNYNSILWQF